MAPPTAVYTCVLLAGLVSSLAADCGHCPKPHDVVLTSRSPHYTRPTGSAYTTWEAIAAFNATRLDWVYTQDASFVRAVHQRNLTVTTAMNANLPDPPPTGELAAPAAPGTGVSANYTIGRMKNVVSDPITAPWMRAWTTLPYYGCINNPDYRKLAFDYADSLLRIGSDAIQHDDPKTNAEAVTWDGGNPQSSGCYCEHCIAGFRAYLQAHLTPVELKALNVTAGFDYAAYLRPRPFPDKDPTATALRQYFVAFQDASTASYVTDLHTHINATARALGRDSVTLSCNNGGRWSSPYDLCDYGLGELSKRDATPSGLEAIYVDNVPAGKQQVMTMPKEGVITAQDILLTRWAVGYAYALGSTMMVPWDIYLPTPHASRFYGNASQFADLYGLVRRNPTLFDGMVAVGNNSALQGFVLAHTGAGPGGDNHRFTTPDDTPPIPGRKLPGLSAAACAGACRADAKCLGLFSTVSGCSLLYRIVTTFTYLEGRSYLKETPKKPSRPAVAAIVPRPVVPAAPNAHANLSDVQVRVRQRQATAGTSDELVVLHVLDYRYATLPAHTPRSGIRVTADNAIWPKLACATCSIHVLTPSSPAMEIHDRTCTNGTLSVDLAAPSPWALLTITP